MGAHGLYIDIWVGKTFTSFCKFWSKPLFDTIRKTHKKTYQLMLKLLEPNKSLSTKNSNNYLSITSVMTVPYGSLWFLPKKKSPPLTKPRRCRPRSVEGTFRSGDPSGRCGRSGRSVANAGWFHGGLHIWDVILPIDEHINIFQRGRVETTNQWSLSNGLSNCYSKGRYPLVN